MKRKIRNHSRKILFVIIGLFIILGLYSRATNPFVRFSIIRDPYSIDHSNPSNFIVRKEFEPFVKTGWSAKRLAMLKSGWHIAANRITRRGSSPPYNVDAVIRSIHLDRFNPEKPYLISGDHFSVLYPRSLGIFYNTALDPRTALDREDWQNRQALYLKTTAFALEVFAESGELSTTIVPISRKAVSLINVYAPPSDTLYSLLYALRSLNSSVIHTKRYPFTVSNRTLFVPATATAAANLLKVHSSDLNRHWEKYFDQVYDKKTGFVKKNLRLSGTKDMAIRSSAFYDNVMVWATCQLAQELEIIPKDRKFLDNYKSRILKTYWREESYFAEDQGAYQNAYSSDWLIAYQSGFLSPDNPSDLKYLKNAVDYIHRNKIDRPFALKYHPDRRPEQLYLPVRLFAPDYGSTAIWSHWGMEYTKLLAHIGFITDEQKYLNEADFQIKAYEKNISKFGGYPELYKSDGNFFKQRMYESVLETGWVVNFEQARAMVKSLRASSE